MVRGSPQNDSRSRVARLSATGSPGLAAIRCFSNLCEQRSQFFMAVNVNFRKRDTSFVVTGLEAQNSQTK